MTTRPQADPQNEEDAPVVARLRDAVNSVNLLLVQAILEKEKRTSLPPALANKALIIGTARGGGEKYVNLLVAAGADPNAPTHDEVKTPLCSAVSHQNADAVIALLAAGADPNAAAPRFPLQTPLWIAVNHGSLYLTDILILGGARTDIVNWEGENLLQRAVSCGHLGVARRLLEAGLSPNTRDNSTNTSLNHLIRTSGDRLPMLDLLLEHGADVNVRRDTGTTPAQIAAVVGQFDTLERLVQAGADPYSRDNEGRNAFYRALEKAQHNIAFELMKRYPGFTPAGKELDEALVLAVRKNCVEAVEVFVKMGADVGQKPGGRTLAQCAPARADRLKRLLRAIKSGDLLVSAMPDTESEHSAAPIHTGPIL